MLLSDFPAAVKGGTGGGAAWRRSSASWLGVRGGGLDQRQWVARAKAQLGFGPKIRPGGFFT
jgi:hypothetical protein